MTPALEAFAEHAVALRVDRLPSAVVEAAKTCLVDALFGCFLVASDDRARAALASTPVDRPGDGGTIVGSRHLAAPVDAAFVNASKAWMEEERP